MSFLDTSTSDFVTTIRLNRPPVNALVPELEEELVETLRRLKDDDATRVVVLTSAIDGFFSAGADIKAFSEVAVDRENPALLERIAQLSRRSRPRSVRSNILPSPSLPPSMATRWPVVAS